MRMRMKDVVAHLCYAVQGGVDVVRTLFPWCVKCLLLV
jgi:hypothetical protein